MIKFIENIVGLFDEVGIWVWILAGVVGLVFIAFIVMMIIKKRAFAIGRSTALAGVICSAVMYNFCIIAGDNSGVYFSTFILSVGGILALVGGLVSMILKKKGGKKEAAVTAPAQTEPKFDNFAAEPVAPAYQGGYDGAPNYPVRQGAFLPPDVEALLAKISRICAGGSTLAEMRDAATQLQKERAKPENKNNPEVYSRLNKALIELLNAIQKR